MTNLTIISGGQTGVDRAALHIAEKLGLPYSGWCPRGGWAEDMPDPPGLLGEFPGLRATPLKDPEQRTKWNVRDSDAILILINPADISSSPGTTLTIGLAQKLERPHIVVCPGNSDNQQTVANWLSGLMEAKTLNAAGPRESEIPGTYLQASLFLEKVFTALPHSENRSTDY